VAKSGGYIGGGCRVGEKAKIVRDVVAVIKARMTRKRRIIKDLDLLRIGMLEGVQTQKGGGISIKQQVH